VPGGLTFDHIGAILGPMSPIIKELELKALQLSPHEREELADSILRSLDDSPLTPIDEAWVAEAERRYDDFKAGKTQGIHEPSHIENS
jgi:putative addiction module component (TIGR02574 family)